MTVDLMSIGEMTVNCMPIAKMTLDLMSIDRMAVDIKFTDEMSVERDAFRQNDCRWSTDEMTVDGIFIN
jgi:hypothetical protein